MKRILFVFSSCLILIAISSILQWFTIVRISGSSMEPSLKDGSIAIVNKKTDYKRGDIAVIRLPSRTYMVKRITGIGGDQILIMSDSLFVNHSLVDNTPNHHNVNYQFEVEVPDGTVFILGDNRLESTDSRDFGCIDAECIIGIIRAS